jgi:AraC family transcriptional regulator
VADLAVLSRTRTDTGQSDTFPVVVDVSSASLWKGIRLEVGNSPPGEMTDGVSHSHLIWISQCASDSLELAFDGVWRAVPMRRNQVGITPAGVRAAARWQTPMRGINVEVPPETVSELLLDDSPTHLPDMRPHSGLQDGFLVETALALEQELRVGNPHGTLYTDALAAAFASHLLLTYTALPQRVARRARRMSPSRLRRVLEFICSNFSHDISLSQLAKVAGLSPFHFSHAFRWNTGVSPYRFVRNVRLEQATRLLRHTRLSVLEIALRCGFYSASHFAGAFHQVLGVTPGECRRSA